MLLILFERRSHWTYYECGTTTIYLQTSRGTEARLNRVDGGFFHSAGIWGFVSIFIQINWS